MKENHIERPHARLGASGAYRWTECLGSVLGSVGVHSYSSEFAREGTAGHEIAQICLEHNQDAVEWIDRVVDGFLIDEDWADPLQVYLDKCREYMDPHWTYWIERPISLEKLNPPEPMYGICDFVAYNAATHVLVVIDLKFGKGIEVQAEDNPQLKYYALGTYLSLPAGMAVERIEAFIVQPRILFGETTKYAALDPLELVEWSAWLLERARLAIEPNAPLKAGPWCKFCPLSGNCVEQARANLSIAQDEFSLMTLDAESPVPTIPDVRLLTTEQIAGILNAAPLFEAFINSVRDSAKTSIRTGATIPGWTVSEGEGRAKFIGTEDTLIAHNLCTKFGLPEDTLYTRKLKTPPQIRVELRDRLYEDAKQNRKPVTKTVAEDMAKKLIEPLVIRPSTGFKLVPVAVGRTPIGLPGSEFPMLED